MAENLIPTAVDDDAEHPGGAPRRGRTMRLGSLAPRFEESEHQVYFDLLERALAHDDTRNIAVTGAYGTGKSSILSRLRTSEAYRSRVVGLSLSTIGQTSDTHRPGAAEDSPTSRVNQIQKEIVKQLLYRTAVEEVPQSRFRRAAVAPRARERWRAAGIGLIVAGLLFLLGPLHPLITLWFEGTWRQVLAYLIVAAGLVALSWGVQVLLRVRPLMSASVNAAITTVTLTKQSDTYFDAYLDEIVYFFEATHCDIVVIEDIDRFEDAQVFDTLRALNGLLNGSRQVGRRVVFIYAIRDSVFERIGSPDPATPPADVSQDHAKEALKRASRTKFFDVIIPVVPFISPDNARDVMSDAMKSPDFKINASLIRLAARHVADMRMIQNIRNEFEIYRHELVASQRVLPDITDDLVFAVVLFKNTHLRDYESIRQRDSSLDHLFVAWRTLVAAATTQTLGQLSALRGITHDTVGIDERAADLGTRIARLRDLLDEALPSPMSITLDPDLEDALATPDGWTNLTKDGELAFAITRNGAATTSFTFTTEHLAQLLHTSVDPADWITHNTQAAAASEATLREQALFLRHHTWEQLNARDDVTADADMFTLTAEEGARLSVVLRGRTDVRFADLVDAILPSELARDLVRKGYVTSHFALYASTYYGTHLSKEAREYIYRCISPGVPDFTFELSRRDVRQILREQNAQEDDADLFSDASILNIHVVDYLLARRPEAAATVARQWADRDETTTAFLDVYAMQGAAVPALLIALVPHWRDVAHYAATSTAIAEEDRLMVVDAVLGAVNADTQNSTALLARYIATHSADLSSVAHPASAAHARAVMGLLTDTGQIVADLAPLNDHARTAALDAGLFPISESNLRVFVPRGRVQLGALRRSNATLYTLTVRQIERYLPLVRKKPSEFALVADTKQLVALIRDVATLAPDTLTDTLAVKSDLRIPDITEVPDSTWPDVVTAQRITATATNVAAYIDTYGVDESLAVLLKPRRIHGGMLLEEGTRTEIAHAILRANDVIPSTLARVKTVATLSPGVLEANALTPESGDLVARLLTAGLLADDATAFSSTLMVDWTTMEKTIKASTRFKTLVSPTMLPAPWIGAFIRSSDLTSSTKLAVVKSLDTFLDGVTRQHAIDIAAALINGGWKIQSPRITALRAAGARADQCISLLANDLTRIGLDGARGILSALGGDYALVAAGGKKRPNFPADVAHKRVLELFIGTSVKRLKEEEFKRTGKRLVALLQ
ncbi:hypothetical protein [Microbacterium sp. NPDC079176]|uniref:YobI family P-loop NTPase n=1 Tax=Microbacterium sp. NPDC079176 TaxID=3154768 RepID=UPI0034478AEA